MHAKGIIVDGKVACVGSLNMTHNAFDRSVEYLFEIRDREVVRSLRDDFENLWNRGQPVTIANGRFDSVKERPRHEEVGDRRGEDQTEEEDVDIGAVSFES